MELYRVTYVYWRTLYKYMNCWSLSRKFEIHWFKAVVPGTGFFMMGSCCFSSPVLIVKLCVFLVLFSYLSTLGLAGVPITIAQPLWWQQDWAFWFLKDNGKCLTYLWLREHQKYCIAFNHANLNHFPLAAWHLFKVIMLNSLLHEIISRLVKEGKHNLNLNLNITCSLLQNYFRSCNCKTRAISSQSLTFLSLPLPRLILKQKCVIDTHPVLAPTGLLSSPQWFPHAFCDSEGVRLKYSLLPVSEWLGECLFSLIGLELGPEFSAWV